jgi:hypothetical protein
MSEIKMTAEVRTDYDCEVIGLPAEMWAECLFKIEGEEMEIKKLFEYLKSKNIIVDTRI